MLFNMDEAEWDAVIRVHLKGTFAPSRWAAEYWRAEHKAGRPVDARIVNTSSTSGLFANPGQSNYGAAKSGIATLSIIAAKELGRYGVTVNAIAPGARTRMTENLGGAMAAADRRGRMGRARAREHRAAGHLARERGVGGDHRAGVPRGWRAHRGRGRLARAVPVSTTARDGTRPSSGPSSRVWSPSSCRHDRAAS